ncbi:MAG TPA: inositol monophosphatase family protein [Aestuariivirgaceae bacterium]|nr:inositol monophosphatase family protein [Aestuariivirgaceae bacterium]
MSSSPLMTVMINAARKAARGIQRDFGEIENLQVSRKGPGDFVTNADKRTEKILRDELLRARSTYGFLGEEGGSLNGTDPDHRWIIDPIDGTTNFIHGVPLIAISIALERKSEVVAGLIYNPIMNELFTAERGRGALLNERRRLRVSARRELQDALLSCGLPHDSIDDFHTFNRELAAMQGRAGGFRRTGSACLDLAYVAAARFDGFWERGLKPWDLAAGMLLVREAGGHVVDIDAKPDPMATGNVLASNAELFAELHKRLRAASSPS